MVHSTDSLVSLSGHYHNILKLYKDKEVLLTEVIQHSKTKKLALLLLVLDARSGFDTIVTEYLAR